MSFAKKPLFLSAVFLICSTFYLPHDVLGNTPNPLPETEKLTIQNRILAKVNGKTISVLDLVKKMDIFLHKYYPQYANSPTAKYQYFSSQWKEVLLQLVDQELILADAEKMELKVTDSEVRETLCERFGPNVMASLDQIGITYEEAREMIHSELVVQRMTWFKVHSKAINSINSKDVKLAYARYCEQNPAKEEWEYQVVSVKSADTSVASAIAKKIFDSCHATPETLPNVIGEINASWTPQEEGESPSFTLSLSETFHTDNKSLSITHKEVLHKLALQSISAPIEQVSRAHQGTVYRIFYLKNHIQTPVPTLRSLYNKLNDQLVQDAANLETKVYLSKLRERYNVTLEDLVSPDFQPFALQ